MPLRPNRHTSANIERPAAAGRGAARPIGATAGRSGASGAERIRALQRRIGNRATARVLQRLPNALAQRAPWDNVPAKFRTDNGVPDIPNSEYRVEPESYTRYAPVNKVRAPGEVFQEGPRSFAYIEDAGDLEAASQVGAAGPGANENEIDLGANVKASRGPENGRFVWDGLVEDNGDVRESHIGHAVEALGEELPTLDHPAAVETVRSEQASTKARQASGEIPTDADLRAIWNRITSDPDGVDDAAAHVFMRGLGAREIEEIRNDPSGQFLAERLKQFRDQQAREADGGNES